MNETEKQILQLADTNKNKPDELRKILNDWLSQSDTHQEQRGDAFLATGVLLYENSYFLLAMNLWEYALDFFVKYGNRAGESGCYINLGRAYASLSQYQTAIDFQEKALVIKKEIGDKGGESRCYQNLGAVYDLLSQYQKAIECHEKALVIKKEIGDKGGESRCYQNLGNAYYLLSQYQKAIEFQEKALVGFTEIGDKGGESRCYTNLGAVYDLLSQYQKAIEFQEKALVGFTEIGDKGGESGCYTILGNAYGSLSQYQKAIEFQEKALVGFTEIGDKGGESSCYQNLGLAYGSLSQYQKAIEFQEKALVIKKEIGDKGGESSCYQNLGLEYYLQNKFQNAYENLEKSINLGEKIGKNLAQEEHKISMYGHSINKYELMIYTCIQLEKYTKAFEYAERSKSKAFLDLMSTSNIKPFVEMSDELSLLLQQEEKLLIQKTNMQRGNQKISSSYEDIIKNLEELYDKIEKIDSKYVSSRRPKTLSILEIQKKIPKNSILVEYFVTQEKMFVFTLTSTEIYQPKIIHTSKENLKKLVDEFRHEIDDCLQEIEWTQKLPTDMTKINNITAELGQTLLEPISKHLNEIETIFFVPHDILHYIPFHALKRENKYLIEDYSVLYLPSASMLQFTNDKNLEFESCASFGAVFNYEAERVAEIFDVKAFPNATKKVVLENLDRDILHFSCHGFFDDVDPLSSGIKLRDEILSAREIFHSHINADLATLSACQTGINDAKPGDELIGLTRALLYAGTSSVVVSLWNAVASATSNLMIEFYKNIKDKKSVAKSLQEAQKTIMNQESTHPLVWAPFVLIGSR